MNGTLLRKRDGVRPHGDYGDAAKDTPLHPAVQRPWEPQPNVSAARRKRLVFVGCVLFLLVPLATAHGDDARALFKQANEAYSAAKRLEMSSEKASAVEKFEEAESIYQRILGSGMVSWAVLYDLGNAQYRLGKIGRAITNYRRAERLAPRNPEIKANLKQALTEAQDKGYVRPPHSFFRSLLFCYYSLNLNEATMLTLASYWLFAACLIGFIFTRAALLKHMSIVLVFVLFFFTACTAFKIYREEYIPRGTVIAKECTVRFGPGEEFDARYEAHEGAEVIVLDERQSTQSTTRWFKVRPLILIEESPGKEQPAPDGWVTSTEIELL